jgi:hypothetical protein
VRDKEKEKDKDLMEKMSFTEDVLEFSVQDSGYGLFEDERKRWVGSSIEVN